MTQSYKLVYFVPHSHLSATKEAVFAAGGGIYADGKYIKCAFECPGTGQFVPVSAKGADPYAGTVDKLELVQEMRVEIRCVREEVVRRAVVALKE